MKKKIVAGMKVKKLFFERRILMQGRAFYVGLFEKEWFLVTGGGLVLGAYRGESTARSVLRHTAENPYFGEQRPLHNFLHANDGRCSDAETTKLWQQNVRGGSK